MTIASSRVFLGCAAGALSMLIFHQVTLQMFFWLGLSPQPAFRVALVPPFNVPLVVSLTFWGAIYGGIYGYFLPWMKSWRSVGGILAGLAATLLAWFVFLPLMGRHAAFSWQAWPMLRSFIAYQLWGLGLAIVLPLMHPRQLRCAGNRWGQDHLTTE